MAPNVKQHRQAFEENCTETATFNDYHANDWDVEDDEEDDLKRLARYIAVITLFFYVLFKYLI